MCQADAKPKKERKKKGSYSGVIVGVTVFLLFLAASGVLGFVAYWVVCEIGIWKQGAAPAAHWKDWGPLGDFAGGILNPGLTFLTFVGVLLTVLLQSRELSLTRREAKRSAKALEGQVTGSANMGFEATFFQMLHLQNEITISMYDKSALTQPNGVDIETVEKGRDVFFRAAFNLRAKMRWSRDRADGKSEAEIIIETYNRDWQWYRKELGHYYRYLYNIIRFIDEAKVLQTDEDRNRYIRLLRAQISDYELVILMYNSMGAHGAAFIPYVKKYELLDNLSDELITPFTKADYAVWVELNGEQGKEAQNAVA